MRDSPGGGNPPFGSCILGNDMEGDVVSRLKAHGQRREERLVLSELQVIAAVSSDEVVVWE